MLSEHMITALLLIIYVIGVKIYVGLDGDYVK
jgi:hypothetical protein